MRKVLQQLGQYKRDTFRCIGLTALEVVFEILMPFITAIIIDRGLEPGDLSVVYRYGALMVVMAFLSLCFGALAFRQICVRRSTPTSRPFHFQISINSACRVLSPV